MKIELLSILFGIAAFLLWAFTGLLTIWWSGNMTGNHYMSRSRPIFIILASLAAATAAWSLGAPVTLSSILTSAFSSAIIFACLFILYMPFFFAIHTSLSVETLSQLASSPNQSLTKTILYNRYASEGFARKRLDRMLKAGLICRTATSGFVLTNKGKFVARIFYHLKAFWHLLPGG